MADNHRRAPANRLQGVFQLGPGAVGPGAAGAHAVLLQGTDGALHLVDGFARHIPHQGGGIGGVLIDTLSGGHQHQGFGMHQGGDHRGGFVVIHTFVHLAALLAARSQLHLAVFLVADGVIVVHDGDGFLLGGADEQAADMLALFRVVEVGVLHQQLPHAELRCDKLPVVLHQDALALGGVVGLVLLGVAAQLAPGALDVVQPADLRRAGGHPDHPGLQLRPQTGENVVVNILILLADQGHGADFSHQLKAIVHLPYSFCLIRPCGGRCSPDPSVPRSSRGCCPAQNRPRRGRCRCAHDTAAPPRPGPFLPEAAGGPA